MKITARTEAEAERFVADVWLVLERAKLPSPKVACKPQPPSLIIELQFEQKIHKELVRKELLSSKKGYEISSRQPGPLG